MRFISVCSGIEAASCAWHPLGWKAAAFSEIEPFPSAVLAHHYPEVPNLGDMTKFKDWNVRGAIDLLVGGTPCQSFSVAGLRKGLDDPRGNLMLTYLAIADRFRPRWLVWENVPGVLSSNGGRDFGTLLGGLGQLGYGFAYRVLDAQHFGVPQRRRRVFVVGHLGDWRRAAAVLFERHSLQGHPAPRRQTGEGAARGTVERAAFGGGNCSGSIDVSSALTAHGRRQDFEVETFIAHSLRAEGFDASEDGTGRGTPLVPVAFAQNSRDEVRMFGGDGQTVGALAAEPGVRIGEAHATLDSNNGSRRHNGVVDGMKVRRLTPRECERLQGFPDDYTLITVRGKPAADGPRYKALGNSMAVPVMAWIGRRIAEVDAIERGRGAAA